MDAPSIQYRSSVIAARQRYLAKTRRARQIQLDLLDQIVAGNRQCAFGQEHGFASLASPRSYANAVPVRHYEDLHPWIEQEASGHHEALTSDRPIVFHRTSSTTGAAKKIPMTRRGALVSFANNGAHRGALLEDHPEVIETLDATLSLTISRPITTTTSGGVPWCFISETDWAALGFERHLGAPGARAPWAQWATNIDDWQYYRLRLALESPLRAILGWFPASLLHLETSIRERGAQLVEDIRNGTVLGTPLRAPNPTRARELETLVADISPWPLTRVWPTLSVVECWTTATSALYLGQLQTCLGEGVEVFPCGYGSTESPIALTFDKHRGTLLDVTAAFFEFLPVDAGASGETALCCDLEPGKDYSLVMTTMSGLYRYAIGDVVRVLEYVNEVPIVEFQSRQGVAASLIAEKMTEQQIVSALNTVVATAGIGGFEAGLCPVYAAVPHYLLALDSQMSIDDAHVTRLSRLLDEQLSRNINYAFYRQSGVVGLPQVETLAPGTFSARRAERRERRSVGLSQQKHTVVLDVDELDALRRISRGIVGA